MEDNIKAKKIGIDKELFAIALDKLTNEGLINGVRFIRAGMGPSKRYCS